MGPKGFQNPTTVLLKETDKEVEQEKEKDPKTAYEDQMSEESQREDE